MVLQYYTYITLMYLFPFLDVTGKHPHTPEKNFHSLVVLG